MIIDVHTHITYHRFPEFVQKLGSKEFTAEILLKKMDMEGIDKSVILPLSNPENADIFGVSPSEYRKFCTHFRKKWVEIF